MHDVDVPGDGKGNCSGRIGGIMKIGDKLVVGFSRQKCEFQGKHKWEVGTKDDMGLLFLDTNFKILKYVFLGKGNDVHQVRTARYGKNILFCSYKYYRKQGNTLQDWWHYQLNEGEFILLD